MTWQRSGSSKRRLEFPPNWYTHIRPAVIARDGGRCVECGQPGNQVDHIGNKHNHDLTNLRLLCAPHHASRTASQGVRASKERASRAYRPGAAPWDR